MRTLVLDIETSPNLAWCWGLFDQRIGLNQIESTSSVLCFAAKWRGEKKVHYYSDFHDGHSEMVEAAWKLVDQADAIVHYNGRAFDMKHLRREFLLEGLAPPTPHADIDLLLVTRRQFKFASNKLQHVAGALGIGGKVPHTGFELWRDCMAGDAKAWALMKKYNIGDITLTEDLYDILLPWIPSHPNAALIDGKPDACPRCSAEGPFQRRGYDTTRVARYIRFQCNTCLGYFQARKSDKNVPVPSYKA